MIYFLFWYIKGVLDALSASVMLDLCLLGVLCVYVLYLGARFVRRRSVVAVEIVEAEAVVHRV